MSVVFGEPPGTPQANNRRTNQAQQGTNKLDGKCRFFAQGRCKFGDLCYGSHDDPEGEFITSPPVDDLCQTQVWEHTSTVVSSRWLDRGGTSKGKITIPAEADMATTAGWGAGSRIYDLVPTGWDASWDAGSTGANSVEMKNASGCGSSSSSRRDHIYCATAASTSTWSDPFGWGDIETSTHSHPNAPITTTRSNPSLSLEPLTNIQAKKACFSWGRTSTCQFGSKCKYDHDAIVPLRINGESEDKAACISEVLAREEAEAEVAQKVQQAREEAGAERAREVRITLHNLQAKQEAELFKWDKARQVAELAQEEAAAAEVADRERQDAVWQRARDAQAARIKEARRAREVAVAVQNARQDAARRAAQVEARRTREAQQEEARQAQQEARMVELAKEEAAMTMQHIALDSTVVTFSTGLAIQDVLLGFESCRITIKNLPVDATIKEVSELFTQQGIESSRFHILRLDRTPAGKQEALLIGHEDLKMVAIGLEEIDFRQERLSFEIMSHGGGNGMTAYTLNTNSLTLTWRAPSVAYVATCMDSAQAKAKVRELDRTICRARRVRVKTHSNPRSSGRHVLMLGFPHEVTDQEVMTMVGSHQVERMQPVTFDIVQAAERIRRHIDSIPGVQITRFEQVFFDSVIGTYSARVHFGSWTQTRDAFNRCDQQRFPFIGNSTFCWLRLPDPIQYTITISTSQYRAQRKSWNDLIATVQDKEGLKLLIAPRDRSYIIRVGGEDKKAVGSLKVRVENIAAGEKLEGWHPSLSQQFMDCVLQDTGAMLRIDCRLRSVKAYGERGPIEAARALVKNEFALLESQEQTILLQRQSVRFFVTRGLAILKEELGDENATLVVSSVPAKIIIKGGESDRHTLDRLIEESLNASNVVHRTSDMGEAICPVCYDAVTSPIKLGCGHAYCSACIRHFLTSASTFPLVCMGDEDNCHVPIPIPVFQRFLPIRQFTNLLETAFITHIDRHPQDFKYCTTPDCKQVYRCTTSDTASIIHCPSCLSSVCSACHEEGHEGMTCAERKLNNDPEEQERLNDELATQSGFKKCPQCAVWIEKTEGCNHMECKCGAHICWVCMGIFDAVSVYEHMNTVHGGMHDGDGNGVEPLFEDEDIAEQQDALHQIALRRAHEEERDRLTRAQQLLQERIREQARMQDEARRQEYIEARARIAELHREDEQDRLTHAQQLLHQRIREQGRIQAEARRQLEARGRIAEFHRPVEDTRREEEVRIRRQEVEQQQRDGIGGWGFLLAVVMVGAFLVV